MPRRLARLLACAVLALASARSAAAAPRRALLVGPWGRARSAALLRVALTRRGPQGRPATLVFGAGFRPVAARAGLPSNATVPLPAGALQVLTA